jgi:hypothetical protein
MRWIPALGGIVVMVLALFVMASIEETPSAVSPQALDPSTVVGLWIPEPAPAVQTIEVVAPDPLSDVELGELDPVVAEVLGSTGYTTFEPESVLLDDLSPSIVATLIENEAVLVIASEEDG